MVEENNNRLIALIENINDNFKILNFLPEFKVKKVIESGVHKQDSKRRYCFSVEKEAVFQIPYSNNIKEISVIVGENGTGKTTIINQILSGSKEIYLIFEQYNNIYIYFSEGESRISLQSLDKDLYIDDPHEGLFLYKHPYIIKFSNAEEFSDGNIYIPKGAIDASRFENIYNLDKFQAVTDREVPNNKNNYLRETINQVRFVEKFKHKVSKFVDYTRKGVTVGFESDWVGTRSKQLIYLDKVQGLSISEKEKKIINSRLVEYFSVLINYMIEIDYSENTLDDVERLLNFHLSSVKKSNFSVNYLIPTYVNRRRLGEALPGSLSKYGLGRAWIRMWYLFYILHLYIEFLTKRDKSRDIYKGDIERIFNQLDEMAMYIDTDADIIIERERNRELDNLIDRLVNYRDLFFDVVHNRNKEYIWQDFWRIFEAPCTMIAKTLSYNSYFEKTECDDFILSPKRVWNNLERKTSIKNLELLQKIEEQLYKLRAISTDFELLSIIIDNISKVDISAVIDSLRIKWTGLSSGELGLLRSFSNLNYAKTVLQRKRYPEVDKNNFLLLLDEVDLGLHPEWQRKWVHSALPIIEKIFENQHLQLIITSHSPILLSDIYKENVIFLTKNNDVSINQEFEKTFGQNIYTLYKSSFFLNKLMGEYAYKTIGDTVEYLSAEISEKTLDKDNLYYELGENKRNLTAKKIIDSIGDIIIANQLKELFERAFPQIDEGSDLSMIDQLKNQINKLQQELEELERNERK